MATFSLKKLISDLQGHPFNTNNIQLVIEEIEERCIDHPIFGTLSTGIRTFEFTRTITEQFIEEIQLDLDRLCKIPDITKYGIFIHSYVTAPNYDSTISDSVHMMRYAKATRTWQMDRVQATA